MTFLHGGNASEFGEAERQMRRISGCSDSHGGLGGF